jgi:hypothetical protein
MSRMVVGVAVLAASFAFAAGPAATAEKGHDAKTVEHAPNIELLVGAGISLSNEPNTFRIALRGAFLSFHAVEGLELIAEAAFSHGGTLTGLDFGAGAEFHRHIVKGLGWYGGITLSYAHDRFIEAQQFAGYTLRVKNGGGVRLAGGLTWKFNDHLFARLEAANFGIYFIGGTWFDYAPALGIAFIF